MKWYIGIFLLLSLFPNINAFDNNILEKIPLNYWIYPVFNKFVDNGILSDKAIYNKGKLITKYRVAVSIVYIIDNIEKNKLKITETDLNNIEDLITEFSDEIENIFDFDSGELILKINRIAGKNIGLYSEEKENVIIDNKTNNSQNFYWENTFMTGFRNEFYDDSRESSLNNSAVNFAEIIYHKKFFPWLFLDSGFNIHYTVDHNDQNYFLYFKYFHFQEKLSFSGNFQKFQNREDINEGKILPSFNINYTKNYKKNGKINIKYDNKIRKYFENSFIRSDFREKNLNVSVFNKLDIFDVLINYSLKDMNYIDNDKYDYISNRFFIELTKNYFYNININLNFGFENKKYLSSSDSDINSYRLKIAKDINKNINIFWNRSYKSESYSKSEKVNKSYKEYQDRYALYYKLNKLNTIGAELVRENRNYKFSDTPIFDDYQQNWYRFNYNGKYKRFYSDIDLKLRRNFINNMNSENENNFDNDMSVNLNYFFSKHASIYLNTDYFLKRYENDSNIAFMQDISTGIIYRF